jgi:hypothetical protein
MVSDVGELTRILRKPTSAASNKGFDAELRVGLRADLRLKLRDVSEKIKADLKSTGQSIFTDENGDRYLIQREPSTR